MKTIDGLTLQEVEWNIYAFGADMKRYARKRDAARLDHTRAKWQRKYAESKGYLENNQERLARFEAVEHGLQRTAENVRKPSCLIHGEELNGMCGLCVVAAKA